MASKIQQFLHPRTKKVIQFEWDDSWGDPTPDVFDELAELDDRQTASEVAKKQLGLEFDPKSGDFSFTDYARGTGQKIKGKAGVEGLRGEDIDKAQQAWARVYDDFNPPEEKITPPPQLKAALPKKYAPQEEMPGVAGAAVRTGKALWNKLFQEDDLQAPPTVREIAARNLKEAGTGAYGLLEQAAKAGETGQQVTSETLRLAAGEPLGELLGGGELADRYKRGFMETKDGMGPGMAGSQAIQGYTKGFAHLMSGGKYATADTRSNVGMMGTTQEEMDRWHKLNPWLSRAEMGGEAGLELGLGLAMGMPGTLGKARVGFRVASALIDPFNFLQGEASVQAMKRMQMAEKLGQEATEKLLQKEALDMGKAAEAVQAIETATKQGQLFTEAENLAGAAFLPGMAYGAIEGFKTSLDPQASERERSLGLFNALVSGGMGMMALYHATAKNKGISPAKLIEDPIAMQAVEKFLGGDKQALEAFRGKLEQERAAQAAADAQLEEFNAQLAAEQAQTLVPPPTSPAEALAPGKVQKGGPVGPVPPDVPPLSFYEEQARAREQAPPPPPPAEEMTPPPVVDAEKQARREELKRKVREATTPKEPPPPEGMASPPVDLEGFYPRNDEYTTEQPLSSAEGGREETLEPGFEKPAETPEEKAELAEAIKQQFPLDPAQEKPYYHNLSPEMKGRVDFAFKDPATRKVLQSVHAIRGFLQNEVGSWFGKLADVFGPTEELATAQHQYASVDDKWGKRTPAGMAHPPTEVEALVGASGSAGLNPFQLAAQALTQPDPLRAFRSQVLETALHEFMRHVISDAAHTEAPSHLDTATAQRIAGEMGMREPPKGKSHLTNDEAGAFVHELLNKISKPDAETPGPLANVLDALFSDITLEDVQRLGETDTTLKELLGVDSEKGWEEVPIDTLSPPPGEKPRANLPVAFGNWKDKVLLEYKEAVKQGDYAKAVDIAKGLPPQGPDSIHGIIEEAWRRGERKSGPGNLPTMAEFSRRRQPADPFYAKKKKREEAVKRLQQVGTAERKKALEDPDVIKSLEMEKKDKDAEKKAARRTAEQIALAAGEPPADEAIRGMGLRESQILLRAKWEARQARLKKAQEQATVGEKSAETVTPPPTSVEGKERETALLESLQEGIAEVRKADPAERNSLKQDLLNEIYAALKDKQITKDEAKWMMMHVNQELGSGRKTAMAAPAPKWNKETGAVDTEAVSALSGAMIGGLAGFHYGGPLGALVGAGVGAAGGVSLVKALSGVKVPPPKSGREIRERMKDRSNKALDTMRDMQGLWLSAVVGGKDTVWRNVVQTVGTGGLMGAVDFAYGVSYLAGLRTDATQDVYYRSLHRLTSLKAGDYPKLIGDTVRMSMKGAWEGVARTGLKKQRILERIGKKYVDPDLQRQFELVMSGEVEIGGGKTRPLRPIERISRIMMIANAAQERAFRYTIMERELAPFMRREGLTSDVDGYRKLWRKAAKDPALKARLTAAMSMAETRALWRTKGLHSAPGGISEKITRFFDEVPLVPRLVMQFPNYFLNNFLVNMVETNAPLQAVFDVFDRGPMRSRKSAHKNYDAFMGLAFREATSFEAKQKAVEAFEAQHMKDIEAALKVNANQRTSAQKTLLSDWGQLRMDKDSAKAASTEELTNLRQHFKSGYYGRDFGTRLKLMGGMLFALGFAARMMRGDNQDSAYEFEKKKRKDGSRTLVSIFPLLAEFAPMWLLGDYIARKRMGSSYYKDKPVQDHFLQILKGTGRPVADPGVTDAFNALLSYKDAEGERTMRKIAGNLGQQVGKLGSIGDVIKAVGGQAPIKTRPEIAADKDADEESFGGVPQSFWRGVKSHYSDAYYPKALRGVPKLTPSYDATSGEIRKPLSTTEMLLNFGLSQREQSAVGRFLEEHPKAKSFFLRGVSGKTKWDEGVFGKVRQALQTPYIKTDRGEKITIPEMLESKDYSDAEKESLLNKHLGAAVTGAETALEREAMKAKDVSSLPQKVQEGLAGFKEERQRKRELKGESRHFPREPRPLRRFEKKQLDDLIPMKRQPADTVTPPPTRSGGEAEGGGGGGGAPSPQLLADAAKRHKVDEKLIRAVVKVESAGKKFAVSAKGARGWMQIMPATFKAFGGEDPHNGWENIMVGTKYLKHLLVMFDGDVEKALAAYNAGPTRVKKGLPLPAETRRYVQKVMASYSAMR